MPAPLEAIPIFVLERLLERLEHQCANRIAALGGGSRAIAAAEVDLAECLALSGAIDALKKLTGMGPTLEDLKCSRCPHDVQYHNSAGCTFGGCQCNKPHNR